ncbi:hypothetical protein A2803_03530 [Candidatus Woesebacteria bacterium RIFCSPHIGHO2_01_FULL_44_21]|uniref:Ribbon-helix-helix protein CopG domain-containing protein n=1 Tax=Candidatus Woesebacteria bacterium RIFCSPHIGHO2_01_FULL_44_21 TaxID=1802503 RepID=A0A1F7YZ59_9BACT|nr:MAG: hypothetical protein A2803_03530 [Candidatus Woesebacteria bacterium RIFCSPHIGHO2_01_FULL_44_21]OGM69100.1 MAG: hypothetical protein A2897_04710 [Candidatus Woesebacteria bacterium RIFCSPLOWO2_01_FULL_44_24b]
MPNLVRTTILLPEDLAQAAKMKALQEKKSLSELIRETLEPRVSGAKPAKPAGDPMASLGVFKIGIDKIYNRRSELYEEHLQNKLSG